MNDCIFCKIVKKEIQSNIIYEDSDAVVFPDINPVKPVHLLIVPKVHLEDFVDAPTDLLGKLSLIVQKLVNQKGLVGKGYRVVVNGGGAQAVSHLHFHLMGPMGKSVKM